MSASRQRGRMTGGGERVAAGIPVRFAAGEENLAVTLASAVSRATDALTGHWGLPVAHAFTAHLRLAPWVNEGVAMRAVDHMAGAPTVLDETAELVVRDVRLLGSRAFRRATRRDPSRLLEVYARGYWAVRRLEEHDAEALLDILHGRVTGRERMKLLASTLATRPIRDTSREDDLAPLAPR